MFAEIYESVHIDDLGPVIGNFRCGVEGLPIRAWFERESHNRENDRLAKDFKKRQMAEEKNENMAEVMSGEVISKDNIIRRETADKTQFSTIPAIVQEQGIRVSIAEARKLSEEGACIIWRPDGTIGESEYALVIG